MSVRTDVVNLNVNINGNAAKNELNQLRKQSADLTAQMRTLVKGTKEYADAAKELKVVNDRMASLRKEIGLTALSQRELAKELKTLNAIKSNLTPGTEEFKNLQKQIDAVGTRLKDVRTGMTGFKKLFSTLSTEVKQFGILAASYLGFEFITQQVSNILSGAGKVSDKLADLQRIAGLAKSEVNDLYQSLRKIDTRTGVQGLLDLAIIAGKLGVEKENIAGFTAALDQLNVALGDELGDADTIATKIGKIINVYDSGAKITGERAQQIGNAIVDLGNKGVATGGFIADFTTRLGGLANVAHISLGEAIGLAAGLEEMGLRSESSTTAIQKALGNLAVDVPRFAKIAGVSIEEFSETLKNKPVEALIQLSAGLVKNKSGFEEISKAFKDAGEDGARIVSTLATIGAKADFMRGKINLATEDLKNNTYITQAFTLKNETLGAVMDKIGKKISSAFTSSGFNNWLKGVATSFAKLIGAVKNTNDAFNDFVEQKNKVESLNKTVIPLIDNYERLARKAIELKGVTKLSSTEQDSLKAAIQGIASAIPGAITQFDEYGRAINVSTVEARKFLELQKKIQKEKNRDAINESSKTISEIQEQIAQAQKALDNAQQRRQSLALKKTDAPIPGQLAQQLAIRTLAKETEEWDRSITKLQMHLADLQNRLIGQKGLRAQLGGDPIGDDKKTKAVANARTAAAQKEIETLAKLRDALAKLKEEYEQIDITDKKSLRSNMAAQKALEAQIDALEGKRQARADKASAHAQKQLETIQQKFAALKAEAQRLNDDADAAEKGKDETKIQIVKDKYASFLQKLDAQIRDKKGALLVDAKEYAVLVAQLSDAQQQELANLYKKQFDARSEKEYDIALQNLTAFYDAERVKANEAYANGLLDRKAYKRKLKQIDADEETDTGIINSDYSATVPKAAKALSGSQANASKKRAESRESNKDASDKNLLYDAQRAVAIAKKGTDAELEAKKALLRQKFQYDTEYLDKSSAQYKEAQAQLNKELKATDKEYLQAKVDMVGEVLQGISNVFSGYSEMLNAKDDATLAKEKANNEDKKASFKSQLDKKLISQAQYDGAIANLDKSMDARQKEINLKQAKRAQAAALLSAGINAALGITKIWATYAETPYIAAILTAIEVAATAVQIAKIKQSTPVGRKGLIVDGPSHEAGGVDLVDHNTGRVKANVEGGEPLLVLSKNTYGNNREVIDQLLYNSQQRNGARIAAPWWNASPAAINANRIAPIMRAGGVLRNNATSTGAGIGKNESGMKETNQLMSQLIAEQQLTRAAIAEQNRNLKAYVVLQDVHDTQALLDKAKRVAGVTQAA